MYAPGQAPEALIKVRRVSSGVGFFTSCLFVKGEKLLISILTEKISTAD
jgi:hypothetical protein